MNRRGQCYYHVKIFDESITMQHRSGKFKNIADSGTNLAMENRPGEMRLYTLVTRFESN